MSPGATALAIAVIVAIFVAVAAFARVNDQQHRDDDAHHQRLLEELQRHPHKEWDEQ